MNKCFLIPLLACLGFGLSGVAHADVLLVNRVKQEAGISEPARGMSMAQVQARFGAPAKRLDPRGGQKSQWPTINRWEYPQFIVYFEKNKVIDVVLVQATPTEIGPAPVSQ